MAEMLIGTGCMYGTLYQRLTKRLHSRTDVGTNKIKLNGHMVALISSCAKLSLLRHVNFIGCSVDSRMTPEHYVLPIRLQGSS